MIYVDKDSRKNLALEISFILLSVLILYFCTIHYDFVWDDGPLIKRNPYFQQSIDWKNIFGMGLWDFSAGNGGLSFFYYRPMVMLSFALEYKLWGLSPGWFHGVNVFLHLLSVLLIWKLCFKLNLNRISRVTAGLFFGLHPVQVPCVAFISCHGDLLVTVFSLLALLFWTKEGKIRWLSLLWIFLAMMSKEAGVILPIVIVLFDRFVLGRPWKDWKKWVSILIWLPYWMLRHQGMEHASIAQNISWTTMTANQGAWRTLAFIGRIIFPMPRSQMQMLPPCTLIQNAGMMLSLILTGFLLFRHADRLQKFLLSWLFLSTVIVADWLNVGLRFSDQLLYIPMISVSVLLATLVSKHSRMVYVVFPAIAVLVWISAFQLPIWKNNFSFWESELRFDPKDASVNINYAAQFIETGKLEEGCDRMQYIFNRLNDRLGSNDRRLVLYNLGNCFLQESPEVSEKYYKEALREFPDYAQAQNNLVLSLLNQEKFQEALEQSKILVEKRPGLAKSWFFYAMARFMSKDFEGAEQMLDKAINMDPDDQNMKEMMKEVQAHLSEKQKR